MQCGDDARSDGATEAIGIADRDHPVADPRLGAVAPFDERQIARVDLQQCEVRSFVPADDPRRIFLAGRQLDRNGVDGPSAGQALNQMVVGDDVAIGRDDEARTERTSLAGARLSAPAIVVGAALRLRRVEAAEEFLERVRLRLH